MKPKILMTIKPATAPFNRYLTLLAIACSLLLSGCIPTIEKRYKTPQTQAKILYFNPAEKPTITPITGAKVYYQAYPAQVVYTDQQGSFELPAVTQTEMTLLMAGHALTDYPIMIEHNGLNDIVLAKASLSMRSLESVNLGALVLANTQQQARLNSATATQFEATANANNNHPLDKSLNWPCDLALIDSLGRAVQTAQRLNHVFKQHGTAMAPAQTYASQHLQSQQLLTAAQNSCQWPAISSSAQQKSRQQALQYFVKAQQSIDQFDLKP